MKRIFLLIMFFFNLFALNIDKIDCKFDYIQYMYLFDKSIKYLSIKNKEKLLKYYCKLAKKNNEKNLNKDIIKLANIIGYANSYKYYLEKKIEHNETLLKSFYYDNIDNFPETYTLNIYMLKYYNYDKALKDYNDFNLSNIEKLNFINKKKYEYINLPLSNLNINLQNYILHNLYNKKLLKPYKIGYITYLIYIKSFKKKHKTFNNLSPYIKDLILNYYLLTISNKE